ncbi:hypothetical protein AURDEDRAFT_165282 [Auricularia subglabra TFB-10046 SS5]|nr:hypothetical protein AURDEDRAFT_165282 [Auricularia subglabra TFB-10046 SS5]
MTRLKAVTRVRAREDSVEHLIGRSTSAALTEFARCQSHAFLSQTLNDECHPVTNKLQDSLELAAEPHSRPERRSAHPTLADIYERVALAGAGSLALQNGFHVDAREAAISFMLHATASESTAHAIVKDFTGHVGRVSSTPVSSIHSNHWAEVLQGVPDTITPVKAHLVYVQTRRQTALALSSTNLVWNSVPVANDPHWARKRAPVPPHPVLVNYSTTFGPNVFAQENWQGRTAWLNNYRPKSSTEWPQLTFDFAYNPKAAVQRVI